MKRHPTRKKLSAHNRGEHLGYNIKYADAGCPLCVEDLADMDRRRRAAISHAFAIARRGGSGPDTTVSSTS